MKQLIKKIYRFIFAPPFDGFGPFISTMILIHILCNVIAIRVSPNVAFFIGLLSYPFIKWFNVKCHEVLGLERD